MKHFVVFNKKEFLQMRRDFKLIWLPVVFILLGMTQPVMSHFLPQILDELGSGQGITIDPALASQTGAEVLASTLESQFNQLGIIIIVIATMMIVHTDKENGMLAFIWTKPVSIWSYILSKITANYMLVALSVAAGYFMSYVYVNMLFSTVDFSMMMISLLIYSVWVLFIVSFVTMISAIFKSQAVTGLVSIAFLLLVSLGSGLYPLIEFLSPATMSHYAMELLIQGSIHPNFFWHIFITIGWISLTMFITYYWISSKKYNINNA